ncbi:MULTISPECIES: enterobactin transporter EntS [Enterobacteriaceae]|uniref:enterobactin transporter EntS n=1 Tax=Enterobacteriaceae TaxID=543 RepID=UPI0015DC1429|nr:MULTISPECIES: enterobactin transporter EntS [unclassified Klebsiella]HAT3955490.1 enterobactin transporter EntS [Kluyvera ascorbata]BBR57940.1 enterobactin exporter EntS [Klebsiella sp. WP4-W18-ESBL-05]BBS92810.1 enterobactin exporter EntS [Klebsiella sp. WP7-S18-CRE-02]BBS97839.1 enterobactin exporter EntS [Klebsiella sp. WP7-S18-CRE-03]BBT02906.1 enterobactin exporter EntS [Klebsiella sp. WP7-S18-ESBL-04]
MNRQSWLLNLSLLKTHPAFRAVFIARFISILSLGLLGVAVPVQIQMMTHSTWQVGLSVTLTGGAMFVGLMVGGVLADRYERRRLILLARGTCGVGFIGLWLNALLPEPSLLAIYLLGLWDGFFASLGVTALLAATPALVGRENLMQAGAITMLTVRLGSVISPMVGGLLLASGGVSWNYLLAALGTFITTLTLLRLPQLPPPPQPREHPFTSLVAGFRFLLGSPLIGGIALLGGLVTMASAVRVLYPALAQGWQMSAASIGLLYAAIPLGAAFGALTSGQLAHNERPGWVMLLATVGAFVAIGLFALMPHWALGMVCLALFGWLSAISSLLQYTLIQTQTPEAMLGRINGLWTAQNVTGDAIGAALLGGLGAILTPVASASASGWGLAIVGGILLLALGELRRFRREVPESA